MAVVTFQVVELAGERSLFLSFVLSIIMLFFFKDLFLLFFHWKGGYTERRDREEDLPSDESLPK